MPRPIHFEMPADQPERASDLLPRRLRMAVPEMGRPDARLAHHHRTRARAGIDGGMMPRQAPGASTVNTIGVESIDATLKTIEARAAGRPCRGWPSPGVGWLAYCVDTEGNTFGVLQPDEKAE